MIKEDVSFLSSDKKNTIHAICCSPKNGNYTKVIQILHGMTEYIEKYLPFIEYLTSKGFIVVGHDFLGHGNSFTNSDDRGYFGARSKLSFNSRCSFIKVENARKVY